MTPDGLFQGNVLDVSRMPVLNIPNSRHLFVEPNNLYTLKSVGNPETIDCIYSKDLLNETKFFKILIKEWFYACKVGGKIIIEFRPNLLLSFEAAKKEVPLLLGDKAKIVSSGLRSGSASIVIKKVKPTLRKNDSINRWTFGILTTGKRLDWLEKEIESIQALNIPEYEIIISGPYKNTKKYKNLRIIPFAFEYKIPWITRKKNIVCKAAKYENLVITHDRYAFDKNWFEGMKKYGNYFEVLCCRIRDAEGKRVDDWITYGNNPKSPVARNGLLDYRDWDNSGYVDGGLYIMKKDIWKKVNWDEKLMWGQGEDFKLSIDMHKAGIVHRMNVYSSCKTLAVRGNWPLYSYNTRHLGHIINRSLKGKLRIMLKDLGIRFFNVDITIKKLD